MSVTQSDCACFAAVDQSWDTPSANGGRPSNIKLTSNVLYNVWQAVTTAQKTAGQELCYKIFFKNSNSAGEIGMTPWMCVTKPNPTDEWNWIVEGDQDNHQSDLTGTERRYTCSDLNANVSAGATSIALQLDAVELKDCYQTGDTVVVYDSRLSLANSSCVWETAKITAVAQAGSVLTLTLETGLQNAYTQATGKCAGIIKCSSGFGPSVGNYAQAGTGTYNHADYPVTLNNAGTVRQDWTLTYDGAGNVDVTGDALGSLGSFPISADIAPVNPVFSKPYFTVDFAGHGNAHLAGDTFKFSTYASVKALFWFKKTPPNCGQIPLTSTSIAIMFETA